MGPPSRKRRHHHLQPPPAQKPAAKSQAAFVPKLFSSKMLEEEEKGLISWSANGERFSVYNPIDFSKLILPQHFKHNNWQSFVRQLNMYGFHKVNDSLNSGQAWEFRHPHFRRGRQDLLPLIKRKSTRSTAPAPAPAPVQVQVVQAPVQPPPQPQPPQSNPTPHRIAPYDPVRDPAGVTLAPGGRQEQIGEILRMMLGLIAAVARREVPIGEELEATRLAICRLEEDWNHEGLARHHVPPPQLPLPLQIPPQPQPPSSSGEEVDEEFEYEYEDESGEEEMEDAEEMMEEAEEEYHQDVETDSSLKDTSGTRDSKSI